DGDGLVCGSVQQDGTGAGCRADDGRHLLGAGEGGGEELLRGHTLRGQEDRTECNVNDQSGAGAGERRARPDASGTGRRPDCLRERHGTSRGERGREYRKLTTGGTRGLSDAARVPSTSPARQFSGKGESEIKEGTIVDRVRRAGYDLWSTAAVRRHGRGHDTPLV